MLVEDIIEDIKKVTGVCSSDENFSVLTKAIQLLANQRLFDPLIGYVNFSVDGGYFIALPREILRPVKITIDAQPTFSRSRIYEFVMNGPGGQEEEINWSFADRGEMVVQNEVPLPGKISYKCLDSADAAKTCTVKGRLESGRTATVTLVASLTDPDESEDVFHEILEIVREETTGECLLLCGDDAETLAQFYPDERQPSYRVIKLSKKVAAVHMMFRKRLFRIKSLTDIIPLDSDMAVINACKAVRHYLNDDDEKGEASLAIAIRQAKEEQAAREEAEGIAEGTESQPIIGQTINALDGIVVGDVYDLASEIFGPIGRPKLFDEISKSVDALGTMANWTPNIGAVDIWTTDRSEQIGDTGSKGHGYYVLPRFVESPISVNIQSTPSIPRNQWFEFHLNGIGGRSQSSNGTWDDAGEVVIISRLPRESGTGKVTPTKVMAIAVLEADDDTQITIYGIEQREDGSQVEVYRDGVRGWTCPCKFEDAAPGDDAPSFVRIDRITKAESTGFISLKTEDEAILLGYWYPDELEPKYRMIKLPSAASKRIRVLFRKRTQKFTSLYEPIPLKSHFAIEFMMRSIKAMREGDSNTSIALRGDALNFLVDSRIKDTPSDAGTLQFDSSTMPGVRHNIQ